MVYSCTGPSRILTFFLACWICCAVTIVLLMAAVAGCAYGYNYSMAEFLTFTKSDVTVYMRRGQFYDRPDVIQKDSYKSYRRKGNENEDGNEIADYESKPQPVDTKPLVNSWMNAHDSQQYAQKLTKYSPVFNSGQWEVKEHLASDAKIDMNRRQIQELSEKTSSFPHNHYKMTSRNIISKIISTTPNIVSTSLWQSGSSKIIMRNFHMSTMGEGDASFNDETEYEGEVAEERQDGLITSKMQNYHGVRRTNMPNDFGPDYTRKPYTDTFIKDYTEEI